MHPANGKKIEDPEKQLLQATANVPATPSTRDLNVNTHHKTGNMSRPQHCLLVLLALALLTITLAAASTHGNGAIADALSEEQQQFQELLNTVDSASLHEVLHHHMKDKFQHGIFPGDKAALEAIRQESSEVAASLIELAKRQVVPGSNGTVIATTTTAVTTEITTTAVVPVPPTTNPETTPNPTTSQAPPPPPTEPTTSPTPVQTSTFVSSTVPNKPTVPPTTAPLSPSSEQLESTSSRQTGNTRSTSARTSNSRTNEGSVTQSIVYTTTFANGVQSTVTMVTVVPADQVAGQTDSPSSSRTITGNASLQTNGAASYQQFGVSAIIGGLGVAVVMVL